MGKGKSVNQHILEMGCMAFELECEGVKVPEELQAVMLMNNLLDSWCDTIGGLIVNMESNGSDGLGLDKVGRRLRDMGDEKKIMENTMSYSSKGRAAKRFNRNCFNCGRVGRRSADYEQVIQLLFIETFVLVHVECELRDHVDFSIPVKFDVNLLEPFCAFERLNCFRALKLQ